MTTPPDHDKYLERVRKLLAKAEAEGCTTEEAQSLTAKAAELMAKYGIDRALLAATQPHTDKATSKIVWLYPPWVRVHMHLYCAIAAALRCQCVILPGAGRNVKIHIFGYDSDIERTEILFTSLMLQMAHALVRADEPTFCDNIKAWRRSWMLGYIAAAVAKVKAAEQHATAEAQPTSTGKSAELVLADRSLVIRQNLAAEYPHTRTARTTYTGSGYAGGYAKGQQANIGGTGLGRRMAGAIGR